jgi:ABC-type lipoprotein export system ATPase subunit
VSQPPLVELVDIGLKVQRPVPTRILHPISLSIERGQSIAIVGPSGAGKTTLASIVGALLAASEGSYRFRGVEVPNTDATKLAVFRRDHIGVVFQNAQLIDDRDALRNVSLGLVDTTVGPAEMEARSLASLATVGLNHLAQRPAALLSGGERQRVALARALVKMPELVIADEPTGALDRANGQAVLDLLFAQQTTILLVTHDRDAAARADEVITLIDGRLS